MGWSSGWNSRKEMTGYIKDLVSRSDLKILDSATKGSEMWLVVEKAKPDAGRSELGKRFILLFVVRSYQGDWGYKDMDEGMGPCYYNVPLRFFDLVPDPPNEYAKNWRAKVRATAEKLARVRAGVFLKNGDSEIEVTGKRKRSWVGIETKTGRIYRLTKGWILGAEIVEVRS